MDWQAKALERFLRYVAIDTQSREDCHDSPSSPGQLVLARMLEEELKSLGLESVQLTPYGILLGKIPASCGWEEVPPLGLIAHLDTSDEASGKNVEPQIVTYSGGVIPLGDSGKVLDPEVFPFLKTLVGQTLVTTNGRTLLGADDKAGIAEIVTMAEALLANTVPHGVIYVVFTPDEELGRGVKHFPFALFPAKYAFTIDGCAAGEIEYKNFNAAAAKVTFFGRSVHPGAAKDIMINAQTLAFEFARLLPAEEVPEKTCKEEGFFHLTDSSGTVSQACLHYIIRDHNREKFEARKQLLKNLQLLY